MSLLMPAAMADAPLRVTEFLSVEKHRLAAHPKPSLAAGATLADVLTAASAHPNVYTGEEWFTELLADKTLTQKQHARALYARAQHRWKKSSNRIGAWQDFTEFTKRHAQDPYANNARIEAGYVKTEIDRIETRMQELQTLSVWFEHAWQLGMRDEAAGRYKRSGFAPEPQEIQQLQAAGYICVAEAGSAPIGDTRVTSEHPNLYWCG